MDCLAPSVHRGEMQQAQEQAKRLVAFSVDWEFPFWETVATLYGGLAQAEQGRTEEGIHQLRQVLLPTKPRAWMMQYPVSLAMLAEAYGKSGKPEEGLQVLPEAFTVMNTTGQGYWEAELYRVQGELTLQQWKVESQSQRAKVKKSKMNKSADP